MAINPAATSANSNLSWSMVQQFMLRHTGNVLRDDQAYLMESRLQRAAKAEGFSSVSEFISATCVARPDQKRAGLLIDALTTHETMFFRDANFWQALQTQALPTLFERAAKGRHIKVWCAACSTGQEPYSLAILLREQAPELVKRVDIIATDISEPTVAHAQTGFFNSLETNRGMDIRRLAKFFVQAPGGFRVKDELSQSIQWKQHNLLGANADPSSCDLVMCRNVLIYFSDPDRNMVIKRLLSATMNDGFFCVGATESCRDPNLQTLAPGLYRKTT